MLHKNDRQIGDCDRALHCFEEAAALGNDDAVFLSGWIYDFGTTSFGKNYRKASEYYSRCKENRPYALLCMGYLYENGKGVSADGKMAERLFEEGLKDIDVESLLSNSSMNIYYELCRLIGAIYSDGNGVERDFAEAVRYFERGAELGNGHCYDCLGYIYDYLQVSSVYPHAL